jgi:hypothetical protein
VGLAVLFAAQARASEERFFKERGEVSFDALIELLLDKIAEY